MNQAANNKRIARNTVALYFRLFLVMAVGFYTSRVVLKTLGVENFGIYNVVGGFVSMLAFINVVSISATQRFLTFSLGTGDLGKTKAVFSTSITINLLISTTILLIGETVGLWFVNEKLVIPPDRLYAANWVYQCSLAALMMTISSLPYKACIVAHERIGMYAILGIVEAVLKLVIVYCLLIVNYDKLIIYSILYLAVSLFIPLWNIIYCRRNFHECTFRFGLDAKLFKEMFSFSIWTLFGTLGYSTKDHCSNIIMNLFLGTAINAARGVAIQVNGAVMSFAESLTTAISPQITKQYAAGNLKEYQKLVIVGARYSCYLMSLMAIPVIVNVGEVLRFWLGEAPRYADSFIVILLIASVFQSMSKTLTTLLMATGDIKWFQIGVLAIMLTELPVAYLLLKLEYPPYYALAPIIVTYIAAIFFRLALVKRKIAGFDVRLYVSEAFLRPILLMTFAYVCCWTVNSLLTDKNIMTFLLETCIYVALTLAIIYYVGIKNDERAAVNRFIRSKIGNKKT